MIFKDLQPVSFKVPTIDDLVAVFDEVDRVRTDHRIRYSVESEQDKAKLAVDKGRGRT